MGPWDQGPNSRPVPFASRTDWFAITLLSKIFFDGVKIMLGNAGTCNWSVLDSSYRDRGARPSSSPGCEVLHTMLCPELGLCCRYPVFTKRWMRSRLGKHVETKPLFSAAVECHLGLCLPLGSQKLQNSCCLVAQLCPTLLQPHRLEPTRLLGHGISQARILEWVTILFSRGSSQPRYWVAIFYYWVTREAQGFLTNFNCRRWLNESEKQVIKSLNS